MVKSQKLNGKMPVAPMYLAIIFYIFIILEYYGNIMKALWIMHRLMYHIQGYVQIFLYLHSSEVGHPKLTRVAHKRWIASGIHLLGWWYTWVDPHPAIDQQQSLLNYKTLWGWRNHKNIGRWKHLESPSVEEFLALLDFWDCRQHRPLDQLRWDHFNFR